MNGSRGRSRACSPTDRIVDHHDTRSALRTVADASSLSTLTVEELAELVAHSVVDRHNVLGLRVST